MDEFNMPARPFWIDALGYLLALFVMVGGTTALCWLAAVYK